MENESRTSLHVIFGAGQVGTPLARRLLDAGKQVRVIRRSEGAVTEGAEVVRGDAADPAFCTEAAAGAAAVYHCMNPPYDTKLWADLVPRYMDNLIAAAGRAGARLVVLDNLYMIETPTDGKINEDTPVNPQSAKGEIRAQAADRLFKAHHRGDVRAVSGRASDFYGPGGGLTHLGDLFWKPALAGKTVRLLIDPDAVHTYHYIPDVAAGLATLGQTEADVLGKVWMLPCNPAETARDLIARFSRVHGRPIKVARIPRPLINVIGWFVPMVREINEMLYQWDRPFIVDDRRFRGRFALRPTDSDVAARETVAWAREHYAAGSS